MEYLKLNNDVEMPIEGLGTFLMTPAEAEAAATAALAAGYEHIDTANAYMNERAVGRAIAKSSIARDKIFVSTKLWPSVYGAGIPRWTPRSSAWGSTTSTCSSCTSR